MKLPNRNIMLLNGAAALVIGGSLFYVVQSLVTSEELLPCSQRYERGVQMGLERGGQPVTSADLQSRASGTDWSLLERTQIVKVAAGPAKYAIEFDLTGARAEHRDEPNDHAGAGFHWSPRPMQSAQSACLAYSVFIPEAFQFGGGGRLPGLTGEIDAVKPLLREGETAAATPEATPFAVNTGWDKDGGGQMLAYGPKFDGGAQFRGRSAFSLGRGKWMRVEQEVVLNTPGSGDGALRLWLDGDLKIDASVAYRDQPAKITGVVSEVVPTGKDVSPKAKDHKISVTPYTIYWK